jgi:hypothetical protein
MSQLHMHSCRAKFEMWGTHSRSSTSRGQTPASITAWILSFVPSERYESAQQASVKTSSSFEWIRPTRAGSAGLTYKKTLNLRSTK